MKALFKSDWERIGEMMEIEEKVVRRMVDMWDGGELVNYEVMRGGCANLNIRIRVGEEGKVYVLRVYLRDKEAVYREKSFGELLKGKVLVPEIKYIGEHGGYRFGIVEYIEGRELRELLLGEEIYEMEPLMYDVGRSLAAIQSVSFARGGILSKNLEVEELDMDVVAFARRCLENEVVKGVLGKEKIGKIKLILERCGEDFPGKGEKRLVHGDFNPANILVKNEGWQWKVSGVMDWEFAFSGSTLWDVANMLRYKVWMPGEYERGFLRGLSEGGVELGGNWKIEVELLNLVALLDCLVRSDEKKQPRQCRDIYGLIEGIVLRIGGL